MPPSSSSLQAARQRLGGKLRELRLTAGLTGRAFAASAGCQASKVSQVEKAVRPASVGDVRQWCRICGASPQQTEELLTEQAAVARLWIAFRDLDRWTGLNATQKMLSGDMWERVRLFRTYQTKGGSRPAANRRVHDRRPDCGPARARRRGRRRRRRSRRADRPARLPAPA